MVSLTEIAGESFLNSVRLLRPILRMSIALSMIVVVEGISASGKSRWCAQHAAECGIQENGKPNGVPDRWHDPEGAAKFWAERNVDRWQDALAERQKTIAVCDTDPLKLHYIWCLWQIGEVRERDWLSELATTRQTIVQGRIGFADRYLVETIDPQLARQRAEADSTRRRRNFETQVRLQPALIAWYKALSLAMPGRVRFGLPAHLPTSHTLEQRYDVGAFDRMIAALHLRRQIPPAL